MKIYIYKKLLFTIILAFLNLFHANAATFTVDNITDVDDGMAASAGTNTLRKCIRLANANTNGPVVDIIDFSGLTGGGPYTIALGTNLPFLTDPVRLDGFTAGGAVVPTPIVVLKGAGAGVSPINNVFNFTTGSSNSIVRGFVIYKTLNDGIYDNGIANITIEGCWVGILETGALALANDQVKGHGIYLTGNANNCIIGTTTAKNVISGVVGHGIVSVGNTGITIKNNYIGTNTTGTASFANGLHGINIDNTPDAIIGGSAANEGNLISGNSQMGLTIINLSANPVIKGNKIGTNLAGTAALPNTVHGINIDNSLTAIIGGSAAGEGNLISGNTQTGLVITNVSSNATIKGNKIGTNLAGTAAITNGVHGISIYNNVIGTTIGGGLTGEGNLISGNGQNGIDNTTTSPNTIIQGNYIGTNATGTAAIGNGTHGVYLDASNGCTIGGNTKLKRNIISGNGTGAGRNGIGIVNCNTVTIQGNFIGISANGLTAIPNFDSGISITNSTGSTIGGATLNQRNVSSGNGIFGMYLFNLDNSTITGNYIGTDSTGNAALSNLSHGVHSDGGCDLNTWTGNVIGGNGSAGTGNGVDLLATTNNTFYGNYFGLGIDGLTDVGNLKIGFRLGASSTGNTIGGTGAGQRNYMSGNGDHGMMFDGQSTGNIVKGNYAGSDISGLVAVPNKSVGLLLLDGSDNTIIGGAATGEGNLFCCSTAGAGIQTQISSSQIIYGNLIGVDKNAALTTGFGNFENGILLMSYTYLSWVDNSNIIGGLAAGQANIIANNGMDGVRLTGLNPVQGALTNFNSIIGNKIYCNGGLGINMTNNNAVENEGIAAPVVLSSTASSINGTGAVGNTIHVYRNQYTDGARCDCEGEIYVGTTTVTAGGTWILAHGLGLTTSAALSVTATQTNATNSTSEFWVCSVPLPVDLLSMEAKKINDIVAVNFSTANESNIRTYNIFRSKDGINFEIIGSVIPVNNSNGINSYSFEDLSPIDGINYYKIQTVENDGRIAYSKIVAVSGKNNSIYLYPNPATDDVKIVSSANISRVELSNTLGQLIFERSVSSTELSVPLTTLSAGVYFVKVFDGEEAKIYKLEKK